MFDFGASHSSKTARFAKPLYGLKPYQGFESLPLRQNAVKSLKVQRRSEFMLISPWTYPCRPGVVSVLGTTALTAPSRSRQPQGGNGKEHNK
jgi:hypothetical protein